MALAGSTDSLPHGLTLSGEAVRKAALALEEAERCQIQIPLLSEDHRGMTLDDAYAVQAEWVRLKRASGDGIVGWKIGLTSKAMQAALSIDIPDSGVLLESMVFANGAKIPPRRFIQPRVEAEIAFVMKAPLVGTNVTPAEVLAATDYVVPALEILDTRITRKDPRSGESRKVFDTVADNAANGGIVLGEPVRDFHGRDLRWVGAIVSKNGEVEETGLGAGVLDNPLLSIAWLAARLATYGGTIETGQIVLSGSFIRPVEAPPGSRIVADYGDFGRVECEFTS
ncbi:2-oxo-hepta-3-ene-1,7-dioic acid hydratase [Sphingopyxis lindanitolerans]|uniref:2-oxo-hepta-3-ene-1,7-dioic acid hydratase n=1 Tax=Sphingopyxis lindanitolerans TaxID=2054227 RepID=A0A2S8B0V6_9SPHN|nr:2-oxo-hepta-3-ene-1,7-dioic acid hydratase [Sphingopyxis lindanitolerans]PQM26024.1 2-oxo-hepta-3-ene-1,7-dioic acid hydratase [Sphingopyxis lindanitolerans]